MSAPRYRNKGNGTVVEAIQFVAADPRTHWHVNRGHPIAEALHDRYWVQTSEGAALIEDGDIVVQVADDRAPRNTPRRWIVSADAFAEAYEAMP